MKMKEVGYEVEQLVMEDLVNALLAERFFEKHPHVELLSRVEWEAIVRSDAVMQAIHSQFDFAHEQVPVYRWSLGSEQGGTVVFPVQPAIVQSYRFLASAGMYEARQIEDQVSVTRLGPVELMRHLQDLYAHDSITIHPDSAEQFKRMLGETLLQTSWALENAQPKKVLALPAKAAFLEAERKAAFRDRPFHPVSKAKLGWGSEECRRYTIEHGQPIQLNWMAVKRERLVSGQPNGPSPMTGLLSDEERHLLETEMSERGLSTENYVPIPVHPWQMAEVLPNLLHAELAQGICVPLQSQAGTYSATSSVRSLLPVGKGTHHVKLPIGIRSLGGLRYLSAVKLMNGQCAEQLLRQAVERDTELRNRLFLCDETQWWAYLPESRDLFADYPRHLSAMVRQYPADLLADVEVRLVPMSALAVFERGGAGHLFDEWLSIIGQEQSESSILQLCKEVFLPFLESSFRLFRLGMMPEIHGQNVVLVWRKGEITGLLLRDHDSLRVHVPWLRANGLEDPRYTLRPGVPESLYHQTPENLLSFFQMLGIHVNSYGMIDAVSKYYGVEEEKLWRVLLESIEQAMKQADLPDEVTVVLRACLLEKAEWPWKEVIRPLVKQHAKVPSSMPYSKGEAQNPFHAMSRVLTS
ncbi:IucA/IucC family protein [Brevibacillus nitrificans]|uniref:IucA/IucC family protein n=1 Tax=Brevibacillus nitrificans TaxID=651560 RepID=A0A3M8CXD7_9BACL|nr:IucA/IucC family protein [Brevibacillus nitrificans]RNB80470.1 IucA/IucC family protein [Brevibacillus nitrificans]